MPLIALGLNHLTAPVSLREQVAFDATVAPEALGDLARQPGVEEAMILSTCNRTELYVSVAEGAEAVPQAWLSRQHRLTPQRLDEFLYRHDESDAVRHMFRVATGLDSMVLGEPQILGQVKDAYQQARSAHALRAPMERLLQHTFAVAKRVRTDTRIGAHTVSVAYTAVRLAEQVFTDLKQACVLLIGAGETIELAARHLADKGVRRLIVANRTLENAQELATRYSGYAIALADLPQHLAEADIVISSTASRQPVVTREMVSHAISARRRRPMFMVDIAVPRDIEPEVARLNDVFLYGIDDLKQVIDENRRSRETAAREAEAIIDLQVDRYMSWRRALTLRNPAVDMRQAAEAQRDEVLGKAQAMLARGRSPDEALAFLANTLTNKLLHAPSARLRDAALSGDLDLLHAAGRLYGLDAEDDVSA
ncbi:glutamyl-tRNA reductase [Luteibacter rhizovicinus]|uniref:Glutamyl-tRNA reductase n=1 Tax=Luteibacter rhizovicinus TaxID=242606 RepID=A0A4R3YLB5_9GAMM|nr:glutamyl-tRNA reductase [Luteibacter rhizovicinus]TCV91844.1 glutamyl-tRNA reductase [Luteibacter rhizovicinus]